MKIDLNTAIDLSSKLGKVKNRIFRVGIELEGAWKTRPPGPGGIIRDGSLDGLANDYGDRYLIGELPSPPLGLTKAEANYTEWMKLNYPAKVNHTCGMHVHLRPRTSFGYQRLMDMRYPATIIQAMKAWAKDAKLAKGHPVWERLAGNSPYCQFQFFPNEQSLTREKDYNRERQGHRYTVVNYCWSRHGTVECRLLPMMDTMDQATEVIKYLLDVTNAYLVLTGAREPKHTIDYKFKGDEAIKDEIRLIL